VGARLNVHLAMSETFLHQDMSRGEDSNIELYGYICDLSASGIGIIIPSISIDARTCSEGLPIRLTFTATQEPVEVQAEAIRCAPLDLREPREGYVIGAKLDRLSEQTRTALTAHLSKVPEV
jgi:hypothetical protein